MNSPQQPAETRPDKSVVEVALSTLEDRLKTVRKRSPQAVRHGGKNAERVHQLRVATRRAAAALDLYHDFVPKKGKKKWRRDSAHPSHGRKHPRLRHALGPVLLRGPQAESPSFIKRTESQRVAAYRDCADFTRAIPRPAA